jgi:integrase
MKIPKKYEETGIFHSIQPEKYKYQPRTTDRRRKPIEKWRHRAVFALLKDDGTWDIMRNAKPESRREAQDWIDERIRQHHDEGTKPMVNRKVLFSTFAEIYKLKLKKRDLATIDEELKKIDIMIGFFKDDAIRDVDYDRIGQFDQYLFDTPHVRTKKVFDKERNEWMVVEIKTYRQNATVHRYMARLRDLLKQAAKAGKIKSVPVFDDVIVPRLEKVRTSTITTDEFLRLLKECHTVASGHDRAHLKLPLIASHELGCRVGELQAVTRADVLYIDHERRSGIIKMPIEKTRPRKYKEVPITSWLYEVIMENKILEKGENEMAFFEHKHYRRSWGTLRKLAGIDSSFKWHDLRAVNTTNRRFSNQAETDLQKQVGHAEGSRMTDKHYYRPHFEQLMDSIKTYDEYMQPQLTRVEAVIETEAVN